MILVYALLDCDLNELFHIFVEGEFHINYPMRVSLNEVVDRL